jgi:hypothetical protein
LRGAGMAELEARGRLWSGQVFAALNKRAMAAELLALAAGASERIGRVRLARDATEALARVNRDPAHHARAAALAAHIDQSARECARIMGSE